MAYTFEASGTLKELTSEELLAADEDSYIIVENQGVLKDNTPYWVYVQVRPSRYKEFRRVVSERSVIRYSDYGTILRYGFDPEIPLSVKEEMQGEWGWDDNLTARLAQDVRQAQTVFLEQQETKRIGDIVAMLKKKQSDSG